MLALSSCGKANVYLPIIELNVKTAFVGDLVELKVLVDGKDFEGLANFELVNTPKSLEAQIIDNRYLTSAFSGDVYVKVSVLIDEKQYENTLKVSFSLDSQPFKDYSQQFYDNFIRNVLLIKEEDYTNAIIYQNNYQVGLKTAQRVYEIFEESSFSLGEIKLLMPKIGQIALDINGLKNEVLSGKLSIDDIKKRGIELLLESLDRVLSVNISSTKLARFATLFYIEYIENQIESYGEDGLKQYLEGLLNEFEAKLKKVESQYLTGLISKSKYDSLVTELNQEHQENIEYYTEEYTLLEKNYRYEYQYVFDKKADIETAFADILTKLKMIYSVDTFSSFYMIYDNLLHPIVSKDAQVQRADFEVIKKDFYQAIYGISMIVKDIPAQTYQTIGYFLYHRLGEASLFGHEVGISFYDSFDYNAVSEFINGFCDYTLKVIQNISYELYLATSTDRTIFLAGMIDLFVSSFENENVSVLNLARLFCQSMQPVFKISDIESDFSKLLEAKETDKTLVYSYYSTYIAIMLFSDNTNIGDTLTEIARLCYNEQTKNTLFEGMEKEEWIEEKKDFLLKITLILNEAIVLSKTVKDYEAAKDKVDYNRLKEIFEIFGWI